MSEPLLSVEGLSTYFYTDRGVAKAVGDVSYSINPGETLGVVGESGCGKSVTALSVMRLIPEPPGRIVSGKIMFDGTDLLSLSEKQMRHVRGNKISMIFQEPMTSLNPVFRVGDQIAETLILHEDLSKKAARDRSVELLKKVGIPSPESRVEDYPHQMSGGMRQRVMIAMALACNPKLIIADEPTTALDVTIQAQILELMDNLRETTGTAIQLITHDLGVIAETAHKVVVMYAGRVVEQAEVRELFNNPLHPYTRGLMRSIPGLGAHADKERLETIPGMVPSLLNLPQGCRFHDRCRHAFDRCRLEEPQLDPAADGHLVRCWLCQE
ncbi:oligopeptide/dipeptide ABC transporter, ATPase subunit [Oleidesulfovibrio alaskensis G20]|jgi:peptide/nickel transport system ATP-binding protein/oligopeptide transport system ATP-binding protein|uniref:Oligopeptide/dipeptide ABC transporter, ATPase subunit n=1 Tax=Oleidesulfovibrio alaskensis (strain ATCC BAA-1058 / DSM 17464 / G20) TaxID=207559 RepID=Q313B3_OLEA2|nr:ABC transporter ATP-binding protein [Oleidesulfovibrio alaskensis]ABB37983.1 oligopeptide/dipeptide ABC transporter, ATPase subunit [Oleidesulfovibrio alaskensis G20]MBG0772873.1 ABC transporter ATP-binding protein [Oleidesulfovibrio alaskensis]MBL3582571.1 ABC transporter ATP-binding protein [Oleidesulfovibrio alaskensis]